MNERIAKNIIAMLDRVALTGHDERAAMNEAFAALAEVVEPPSPEVVPEA